MGLNTAASISFSQINSTSYFTNGNLGINTTNPTANLDVVGTINASGLSSLASITTGALSATNVVGNSISAGTLSATTITGSNLSLSGNLSVAGTLTTVNITSTNMLNTNISAGTINATGLSSLANATATNISTGGLNATGLSALANATATNVSAGIVIVSTGITTGTINATGLTSLQNVTLTNVTASTAQITNENVTTSTIATLRVSSNLLALGNSNTLGNIYTTGGNVGIGTSSPLASLDVRGDIVIPTSYKLTMAPTDNFIYSANAVGHYSLSWNVDTSFAGGAMSYLSGFGGIRLFTNSIPRVNILNNGNVGINNVNPAYNLDVSGTINVTGTSSLANVTVTNISTGGFNATGLSSLANATVTNVSTGGLNASGLSALVNATVTNVSTGVVIASTGITTAALLNTGLISTANLFSTTATVPNIVVTNVSTGTLNATGTSVLANATATNVSTGTLNASTGITAASAQITNENVTTSTIATLRVSSNLLALGNSNTLGNIFTTGGNVGINTTTPGSTLDVNGGLRVGLNNSISTFGAHVQWNRSGNDGETWLINQRGGGVSDSIRFGSSSITNVVTELWRFQPNNLYNMVGGNVFIDGFVSGTQYVFGFNTPKHTTQTDILQVYNNSTDRNLAFRVGSKGTSSGTDYVNSTVPFQAIFNSNTIGNLYTTGGNVGINTVSPTHTLDVSGTIRATTSVTSGLLSATNIVGNSISAGTLSATTITGANLSLSGNLSVAGTLTTVNITSTNMLNTNISAGTINATGFTSLQNVTLTNVSAATIQASVTNNTQFTPSCVFANNSTVGGSAVASFLTPNMPVGSSSYPLYLGKSLGTGNCTALTYSYTGLNNAANYIALEHYGKAGGIFLLNNGNVGIGNTSPNAQLQLSNTVANRKLVLYESQNNDHEYFGLGINDFSFRYQTGDPNASHDFYAGTSTTTSRHLMKIRGDGYIGIGTTSPGYTLDVSGTARVSSNMFVGNGSGGISLNLWDIPGASWQVSTGDHKLLIGNGTIGGSIVNRITVSSTGNVGIGNASPNAPLQLSNALVNRKLVLYDVSNNDHQYYGLGVNNSSFRYQVDVAGSSHDFYAGTSTTTSRHLLRIRGDGNIGIGTTSPSGLLHLNNAALFTSAGNLTCTGDVVSFGSLSDRRLKKNIETIETAKALDIVSKLRAVSFDWKDDIFNEEKRNTSDLGFIAQEVEELIPEAVSEYTQIESGEVYKNIKHERLVPYLLSAIQYLLSKQT